MERRVRAHVRVTGVVQGVFFRASTVRAASDEGLDGWVRNLPDGRVEAVLEGPAPAVQRMIEWLGVGPPRAIVEDVQVTMEDVRGERGFTARQ